MRQEDTSRREIIVPYTSRQKRYPQEWCGFPVKLDLEMSKDVVELRDPSGKVLISVRLPNA